MQRALELADRAGVEGEVPVGALVVRDGRILGEGWNRTEALSDPSAHAEILALRRASASLRNHRLTDCLLVTTLEPCVMCLGAALESRVRRVFFGAWDLARGAAHLWQSGALRHFPTAGFELFGGVCQAECENRLLDFFRSRRASRI